MPSLSSDKIKRGLPQSTTVQIYQTFVYLSRISTEEKPFRARCSPFSRLRASLAPIKQRHSTLRAPPRCALMGAHSQTRVRCFRFYQAEDGIRDDLVTGVQTCALPIY